MPAWVHLPLVMGDDGQRLAKRHGAMGIRTLRERGVSPDTLRGELLATLGISDAGDRPLRDLATRWSPAAVPRLAPRWSVSANRFEAR